MKMKRKYRIIKERSGTFVPQRYNTWWNRLLKGVPKWEGPKMGAVGGYEGYIAFKDLAEALQCIEKWKSEDSENSSEKHPDVVYVENF
jgi:hypothetical protein